MEEALAHLLQGSFAPRSEKNIEESRRDFTVTMATQDDAKRIAVAVPDVTGELWNDAVSSSELPEEWMNLLKDIKRSAPVYSCALRFERDAVGLGSHA